MVLRGRTPRTVFAIGAAAALASGCALRVGSNSQNHEQAQTTPLLDAGAVDAEAIDGAAGIEAGADAIAPLDAATDAAMVLDAAAVDPGATTVSSADGTFTCSHEGAEIPMPFGTGTDAFSWLWDTDHYVIVFVDPTQGAGDIDVVTLAVDGTVRTSPVPVEATPAASDLPSLVKTPTGYLVVWEEGSAGESIFLHALGPDASPVGDGVAIGTTQLQLFLNQEARPVIGSAPGGQAAVTWMNTFDGQGGVELAYVDETSLAVTGPARIAASDQAQFPWISGDGQILGMIWSDLSPNEDAQVPAYEMQFATFTPPSLTPTVTAALPSNLPYDAQLGRLTRTGSGFLATWEDEESDQGDNQVATAFVDASGNLVASGIAEQPHTGDANWSNVAVSPTYEAIAFYQYRGDQGIPQIFMSFFDTAGNRTTTEDMIVSSGTVGGARFPDVAWTGTDFGVMYIDMRNAQPGLFMQRVLCNE